jgi:hypothetical protein
LFCKTLVSNIREEIDRNEIFSFPVNFNERFHTQVRYIRFWDDNNIRVIGNIVPQGNVTGKKELPAKNRFTS